MPRVKAYRLGHCTVVQDYAARIGSVHLDHEGFKDPTDLIAAKDRRFDTSSLRLITQESAKPISVSL